MSELKAITSGEIYNMIEYEDCYRTDDLYYPKTETDKVIAELKADYKEACDRLQTANLIKDEQLAATRHSNYKRCLAMAKRCQSDLDQWIDGSLRWQRRNKWYKRWLELADRFKEAK